MTEQNLIESIYATFGAVIRHARLTRGLSQEKLAREVGLSRVSIANIEAGRQRVLLHDAITLSTFLDVSLPGSLDSSGEKLNSELALQPNDVRHLLGSLINKGRKQ